MNEMSNRDIARAISYAANCGPNADLIERITRALDAKDRRVAEIPHYGVVR